MRSGGCAGYGGCCVHGDQGSDKSTTQTNQVFNQQVTQSLGSNARAIGFSGSTIGGNVTVVDASPEIVNKALEAMGTAVNSNLLASLSASDVSKTAIKLSHDNVNEVLQTLEATQRMAQSTVDAAVEAAQGTALRATPVHNSENITKQILVAAVISIGLVALSKTK